MKLSAQNCTDQCMTEVTARAAPPISSKAHSRPPASKAVSSGIGPIHIIVLNHSCLVLAPPTVLLIRPQV